MKASRLRKLAVALMLACAGIQPALGESLVASALALGIRAGDDHPHWLAWRSDGRHLDIVLSHGESAAHSEQGATPGHDHPACVSERDHVVHFTAIEATNATPRRAFLNATPVLVSALARATAAAPAWPTRAFALRAGDANHLKTIVLRV